MGKYERLTTAVLIGLALGAAFVALKADTQLSAIYQKVRPSTVMLLDPESQSHGGSGFAFKTPKGTEVTMTNKHVCQMGVERGYIVGKADDGVIKPLPIIAISDRSDLCAVDKMPRTTPLAPAKQSPIYQQIYIVGHPLLLPTSISTGVLNAREEIDVMDDTNESCTGIGFSKKTFETFFGPQEICVRTTQADWSDAKAFPGNSGSPVVDSNGDVVGVLFAGSREGFSFIVPLDDLLTFTAGI